MHLLLFSRSQSVGLFQDAQGSADEMQTPRDQGLHRLALGETLADVPGIVDGLLNRRHHLDGGFRVQGRPLVGETMLDRHLVDLGRVVLAVDKVSLVARGRVGDIGAEDDMVESRLSVPLGGLEDGIKKVDSLGAALLVKDHDTRAGTKGDESAR